MSRGLVRRLGITLMAFLPGCRSEDDSVRRSPSSAPTQVVRLTAREYALEAPDTVPAGWTTLRLANHGQEIHYGHLVRLDSGRTIPELVDAYATAIRTSGPRPKWVTRFGGPGGTVPGDSSSVTQYLEPGSYVWICPVEDTSGNPHFAKGEHRPLVVRTAGAETASPSAPPAASLTVRLLDYSFEPEPPPKPGRHTVRVANAGAEPHDLVLMKLAAGKTLADVQRWLNPERARRADERAEPPPTFESLGTLEGGVAAMSAGKESFFDTELTPGDYVLLCMATAPDGRSHIEHGMIRKVSVR